MDEADIERYARHLVLPEIGGPGQAKLARARVLVVGAGGLGSPLIQYLAAAGVGAQGRGKQGPGVQGLGVIGVIDDDVVSLSNLQRQVIHGTPDIGRLKVESAREAVARLNPGVAFEAHPMRLTPENAAGLIARYDLVADGCDNFATRYLVADACEAAGKTLVTAALGRFDATLTTLKPHETGEDGRRNPSFRDLFPEAPPPGTVPSCAEAGIIGALAGMMGAMMALEVIRQITGFGEGQGRQGLVGRLLMVDAMGMRFQEVGY
jgi:adenylyltransferase/sulfurtransferase